MSCQTPENRCMPLEEWPQADRSAWLHASSPRDLFFSSTSGSLHQWKPSTQAMILSGYGRWLTWLNRTGLLGSAVSAADLATKENVVAYRAALQAADLADYSVAGRLQQLANALRAINPLGDHDWIHRTAWRLHSAAVPRRDQLSRMQPVRDVMQLGLDLMEAAEIDRFRTACDRATLFRDGLILAFLVQRPFRRANLAAMTLGVHVEQREGSWRIYIGHQETKTGEAAIYCDWPKALVDALECYLTTHREVLLEGEAKPKSPTQALWISRRGSAMTSDAIKMAIALRTREEFGRDINLHSFRHMAATAIATENPAGADNIMRVLNHASMKSSDKYYNRAQMLGASESFNTTIAALRKKSRAVENFNG